MKKITLLTVLFAIFLVSCQDQAQELLNKENDQKAIRKDEITDEAI